MLNDGGGGGGGGPVGGGDEGTLGCDGFLHYRWCFRAGRYHGLGGGLPRYQVDFIFSQ